MDPQNMQNQDMGLVLSSDAKPRLKWTPELHQRFIDAVAHLGGPDKATPKTLMRVMAIPGLTLYHLKSHLQKFRLGQRQQSETYNGNKQEDYSDDAEYRENHRRDCHFNGEIISSDGTQNQINEGLQIAQALQMQMEVQRKLHEQMEVQRHLQLRIEAQGKYLKSVLKKAQETLAGYNSASSGVELVKAELSQLVSMAITGSSVLTEIEDSSLKETERQSMKGTGGSLESSLTSSESSGRKEENQSDKSEKSSLVLSLMDMNPRDRSGSSRKRSGGDQQDQAYGKRSTTHKEKSGGGSGGGGGGGGDQLRKINSIGWFDLNSQCVGELGGSGAKAIDLNCKGTEQFNGHV